MHDLQHRPKRALVSPALVVLVGLSVGLVGFIAVRAVADGDPATDSVPRTLPYQGLLVLDDVPVNATGADAMHIMFMLYDGPNAQEPVYRQQLQIDVFAGRFTAMIGPTGLDADDAQVPVSAIIANADDLHLGMTLLGDVGNPDDDVALLGRQRLHATPYAMWTTSATDISVANGATVGGGLTVSGDLTVGGDVALPADTIGSVEVADGTLMPGDLNVTIADEGLQATAVELGVDGAWMDARVRGWMREHCFLMLGWRDGCNNCGSEPSKYAISNAAGTCVAAVGSDTSCRANGDWGGVNTDGTVNGDDVFHLRFICD